MCVCRIWVQATTSVVCVAGTELFSLLHSATKMRAITTHRALSPLAKRLPYAVRTVCSASANLVTVSMTNDNNYPLKTFRLFVARYARLIRIVVTCLVRFLFFLAERK